MCASDQRAVFRNETGKQSGGHGVTGWLVWLVWWGSHAGRDQTVKSPGLAAHPSLAVRQSGTRAQ
jgi:hypothetical protein